MNQCESCGMPLDSEHTSKQDKRYCTYCQNQETGELATKEQVREGSINARMQMEGKTRQEVEPTVDQTMSDLPRWQESN